MSREKVVIEPLQELGSSGYEMVKDEPDIRGWKIVNGADQQIGKVKELLFDVNAQKVRYLVVNLDGKPLNLASRDIIVPVGLAELDDKQNVVFLHDVSVGHLATLPEYKKGNVTYETERAIRDVFIPHQSTAAEKLADFETQENPEREAFYNTSYFDDKRLFSRRHHDYKPGESIIKNEARNANREKDMSEEKNSDVKNSDVVKEDVVYIPDENDPNILRKAKIVRETPGDKS